MVNSVREARNRKQIKYAVVGLGHIAQAAVLPAFAHARNSQLAALVSDDPVKRKTLGAKYELERTYSYDQYDECLEDVDAVYIALPNSMHFDYTMRAARAGVHILCEKPLALTSAECSQMIRAADENSVWLMTAYRLHFEAANLKAIEIAQSGDIGEPRIFSSVFGMQVREGDIRLQADLGGGSVYDLGVYCINAARSLFRDEPTEVFAYAAQKHDDSRFDGVDEMTAAVLRFPEERLATFVSSFGSGDVSSYRIVGTKGELRVDPAYEYGGKLAHTLSVDGKVTKKTFAKRDQFGPELVYFSRCIARGVEPEPSGKEGLADVRVIEAILQSAATGRAVPLPPIPEPERPSPRQQMRLPPIRKPELVHVADPAL